MTAVPTVRPAGSTRTNYDAIPTTYTSPAARRFAEQVTRQQADAEADRFRMPETRAELERMTFADRCRVYREDQARYQRLMGGE